MFQSYLAHISVPPNVRQNRKGSQRCFHAPCGIVIAEVKKCKKITQNARRLPVPAVCGDSLRAGGKNRRGHPDRAHGRHQNAGGGRADRAADRGAGRGRHALPCRRRRACRRAMCCAAPVRPRCTRTTICRSRSRSRRTADQLTLERGDAEKSVTVTPCRDKTGCVPHRRARARQSGRNRHADLR